MIIQIWYLRLIKSDDFYFFYNLLGLEKPLPYPCPEPCLCPYLGGYNSYWSDNWRLINFYCWLVFQIYHRKGRVQSKKLFHFQSPQLPEQFHILCWTRNWNVPLICMQWPISKRYLSLSPSSVRKYSNICS